MEDMKKNINIENTIKINVAGLLIVVDNLNLNQGETFSFDSGDFRLNLSNIAKIKKEEDDKNYWMRKYVDENSDKENYKSKWLTAASNAAEAENKIKLMELAIATKDKSENPELEPEPDPHSEPEPENNEKKNNHKTYSDEELKTVLLKKICDLKRFPLTREICSDGCAVSYRTYANRWGSITNIIDEVGTAVKKGEPYTFDIIQKFRDENCNNCQDKICDNKKFWSCIAALNVNFKKCTPRGANYVSP